MKQKLPQSYQHIQMLNSISKRTRPSSKMHHGVVTHERKYKTICNK